MYFILILHIFGKVNIIKILKHMKKKALVDLIQIVVISCISILFQNCDKEKVRIKELTDDRDGNVYKTVKIGDQKWMAENMRYETGGGSHLYDNNLVFKEYYGLLYDYNTACLVCPKGWHLPSNEEWNKLELFIGMNESEISIGGLDRGTSAYKLKSISGWSSGNATDEYGFNALPSGWMDNSGFEHMGDLTIFWGTDISRRLDAQCDGISTGKWIQKDDLAFSVRCIKD
jgi:uncharacterized protein (TIGR02145 family)